MSNHNALTAAIIGNSTSSLAGFVAAELVAEPLDGTPPANGDFDVWKAHVERRFEQLCAALVLEEPELLTNEVRWSRQAFRSRDLPLENISRTLDIMATVLREKLPSEAAEVAVDYLNQATEGLLGPEPANERLDASNPADRMALEYLENVLEGDRNQAIHTLLEALEHGTDVFDLYESVLVPAQRQVGVLWHNGDLSIAEEHFCTTTTERTMTILAHHARASDAPPRGTAIASTIHGNAHDLPLRVLADFFEIRGWRSILLGRELPALELAQGVHDFDAELLLLSATLAVHLPTLETTIAQIRGALPERDLKIVVGGRAFEALPHLWQKMGADGFAASARAALDEADRLLA